MTNYASISEAITNKLIDAELRLDSIEMIIKMDTMPAIDKLEKRYANGENVGKALDRAYHNHDKACAEYEAREYVYSTYKEASELYKQVCRLIELANDVEINGL